MFSIGIFAGNPDQVALAANPILEEILGILTNEHTGNQAISDKIDSLDSRLDTIEDRLSNIETKLDDSNSCTPTTEICDGVDNNCNGIIDEGDVCDAQPISCNLVEPSLACGDGIQCQLDGSGNAICTELAGSGTQGASCSDTSECAAGYTCVYTGSANQCLQWCQNNSQCSAGTTCVMSSTPIIIDGQEYGVCN